LRRSASCSQCSSCSNSNSAQLHSASASASPRGPKRKIDKNFDVSVSSTFFVLSCFRVFLSDVSSKALYKTQNVLPKNRVEKFFTKKSTKIQKLGFFFSILFYHVFGRFSVRGVQKQDKQYRKKITSPGTFLASEEPRNQPATCESREIGLQI
jgi:hypothetical protein